MYADSQYKLLHTYALSFFVIIIAIDSDPNGLTFSAPAAAVVLAIVAAAAVVMVDAPVAVVEMFAVVATAGVVLAVLLVDTVIEHTS